MGKGLTLVQATTRQKNTSYQSIVKYRARAQKRMPVSKVATLRKSVIKPDAPPWPCGCAHIGHLAQERGPRRGRSLWISRTVVPRVQALLRRGVGCGLPWGRKFYVLYLRGPGET